MDNTSAHLAELARLEAAYGVPSAVLEDLCARRRAGARDVELINLLAQADRGGLKPEQAGRLIAELPRE
jgi:hypothetical protein